MDRTSSTWQWLNDTRCTYPALVHSIFTANTYLLLLLLLPHAWGSSTQLLAPGV